MEGNYEEEVTWETDPDEYGEPTLEEEYDATQYQEHGEALNAYQTERAAASEAFVTFRQAKTRLNEVRKDRWHKKPFQKPFGWGKGDARPEQASPPRPPVTGGKGGGKSPKGGDKVLSFSQCWACGRLGHFQGSPECPRSKGKGGKSSGFGKSGAKGGKGKSKFGKAYMAGMMLSVVCCTIWRRDLLMGFASSEVHLKAQAFVNDEYDNTSDIDLETDIRMIGDTGANIDVAGSQWVDAIDTYLRSHVGLKIRRMKTSDTTSMGGLGGTENTVIGQVEIPVGIEGRHQTMVFQEILGENPGLLGSASMRKWGGVLWMGEDFVELHGLKVSFTCERKNGHLMIPIMNFQDDAYSDPLFEQFQVDGAVKEAFMIEKHTPH